MYNLCARIEEVARSNKFIQEVTNGDVYEVMNVAHCEYMHFCYDIVSSSFDDNTVTYTFNFYVVDIKRPEGTLKQYSLLQDVLCDVTSKIGNASLLLVEYYVQKFAELCVALKGTIEITAARDICY